MKKKTYKLLILLTLIPLLGISQVNEQDSLALVALYNSTDGANWTCGCNQGWLDAPVNQWAGIAIENNRVTEIYLSGGIMSCEPYVTCSLNGTLPNEIGDLTELKTLNLSNNLNLTGELPSSIGNLTQLEKLQLNLCDFYGAIPIEINNINTLRNLYVDYNNIEDLPIFSTFSNANRFYFAYNKLTFEDFESNMWLDSINAFNYSPQDSVNNNIDTLLFLHDTISMATLVGGAHNIYQWYKNNILIDGANNSVLTINDIRADDAGLYTCAITNSIVPNLTLWRRTISLNVDSENTINTLANNEIKIVHQNENIIVETDGKDGVLLISDITGKVLFNEKLQPSCKKCINISNLPKGLLIVSVQSRNKISRKKIINY